MSNKSTALIIRRSSGERSVISLDLEDEDEAIRLAIELA
jgi:hypothetical protein